MEEAASLDNYKGIVALDKNAYFAGEKVAGKIVLGRYDATMIPDNVTLNGKDYKNIQSGQVIIDIPAGNVGTHDIKGKIAFTQNGEKVEVPFESSYSVIPEPSNAVVSADKMNVVYRGVDNPVSVSLPGVSDNNLKVSALNATLTGGKGKFIVKPGKGKEVTINVSAKLSSGKTVNSKATFRTKNLPPASGSIRGQFGTISMPKLSLSNIEVAAAYEDFVFDLKLTVKSFNLFVPGQLSVQVEGNKLSAAAKKVLNKAKRGDRISIFDIKAVKSDGVKIPKVRDVNIELTN
jgi:gliding motility-associated protein GldM